MIIIQGIFCSNDLIKIKQSLFLRNQKQPQNETLTLPPLISATYSGLLKTFGPITQRQLINALTTGGSNSGHAHGDNERH